MMKLRFTTTRSNEFEKIVWEIFFKSRGRGVYLDRHFPWISLENNKVNYLIAENERQAVGGLVVMEKLIFLEGRSLKLGLIGLVCVMDDYRGNGVASDLVSEVISFSKTNKFDALTLWTGKPEVYRKHGFVNQDLWLYGVAKKTRDALSLLQPITNNDDIPPPKQRFDIPLPPFALSIYEYFGWQCSAYVAVSAEDLTLMEYKGGSQNVANLLSKQLPTKWRINVVRGDPLIEELKLAGFDLEIMPANLQMWLSLNSNCPVNELAESITFPIFERI